MGRLASVKLRGLFNVVSDIEQSHTSLHNMSLRENIQDIKETLNELENQIEIEPNDESSIDGHIFRIVSRLSLVYWDVTQEQKLLVTKV